MNILVVIGKGKSLLYCSPCRTVTFSHVILWNHGFSLGFYILVVKILVVYKKQPNWIISVRVASLF